MILFIGIATIFFVGAWAAQPKVCFRIGFISLFFCVLLRNQRLGGYDITSYQRFFESTPALTGFTKEFWNYHGLFDYGWGYGLLNSFSKTIWDNYFSFQIVDTLLVFLLLYYVLRKLEMDYQERCLFMFVYFCTKFLWFYFVLLRQNIADLLVWIVIIRCNSERIRKKRSILSDVILIFIASLFHSTAILNIGFYLVYLALWYIRNDQLKVYFTYIMSIAVYFLTSIIIPLVPKLLGAVAGERYGSVDYTMFGTSNILNYFLRFAYLYLIYKFGKTNDDNNREMSLNATIMAVLLGSVNTSYSYRILEYFAVGYYSGMAKMRTSLRRWGNVAIFAFYFVFIAMLAQYIIVNKPLLINNYTIYDFG